MGKIYTYLDFLMIVDSLFIYFVIVIKAEMIAKKLR